MPILVIMEMIHMLHGIALFVHIINLCADNLTVISMKLMESLYVQQALEFEICQ